MLLSHPSELLSGRLYSSDTVISAGPGDRAASNGSGLGLAIVQAIAVEHDGRALVVDSENGGARFEVQLPLARENANETVNARLGPV